MTLRVFVIAGEPSGDKLGAAAMAGLKTLTDVTFDGVGGPLMEAEGLSSRFPMHELSVMGIMEILPKYAHLKRRIRETAEAIVATKPDVVLTIDSPDFCLRVAALVKARAPIRICHYVAPTVWAWRPKRAEKMAQKVDQLLALFPFEPPYFTKHGLRCDFVGHPVVTDPQATESEAQAFRARHDMANGPLALVLPGSRVGEVTRLSERFGAALGQFAQHAPGLSVVLPTVSTTFEPVTLLTSDWPVKPLILPPDAHAEKRAAFKAADIALAASGTVSLELAAADTPMVVAYDMNALTYRIIKHKALIDTVTLVNLVSETRVVPEFLGPDCQPETIATALAAVYADPAPQHAAMAETMARLGQGATPPGIRAAQAILDGLAS